MGNILISPLQKSSPPAHIILDRYVMGNSDYIRVSLLSDRPMAGFLVTAVDTLDTVEASGEVIHTNPAITQDILQHH